MKRAGEESDAVRRDEAGHFPNLGAGDGVMKDHTVSVTKHAVELSPVRRQRSRRERARIVKVLAATPARSNLRGVLHVALNQRMVAAFVGSQVRARQVEE